MVSDPENYPWSSHRVYLGLNENVWLSINRILSKFHPNTNDARSYFKKYVLNGIGAETAYDFQTGLVNGMIGDDEFINKFSTTTSIKPKKEIELAVLINKICEQNNLSAEEFCVPGKNLKPSHARALASLLVRETDGLSLEYLGKLLDRDPSGLTKLANRLKNKCNIDPLVAKQVQEIRQGFLIRKI